MKASKTTILSFVFSFTCIAFATTAQTPSTDCLPTPTPNVLVYDIADILSSSEEIAIQNELVKFKDATSNVILVITHPDFCGEASSVFAIEAGDKMGVGRSDLDNGIVLAIKPRNDSGAGQVFIAVGEGLEGAIPDILTGRIVDRMIPDFKRGDWLRGISIGLTDLAELASGEISESEYLEKNNRGNQPSLPQIIFFILLFGAIPFFAIGANTFRVMRMNDIAFIAAMTIVLAEMRMQNNSYNNFSQGRGRYHMGGMHGRGRSGGFSSGGFGGFGGGGFGGGGAGGSF